MDSARTLDGALQCQQLLSAGIFPNLGIEPGGLALQADSLYNWATSEAHIVPGPIKVYFVVNSVYWTEWTDTEIITILEVILFDFF